jgi:hypothetical protein
MTTCLVKGGVEGSSITTMLSRDEVDSNRSGGFFVLRCLEIDVERGGCAATMVMVTVPGTMRRPGNRIEIFSLVFA